MISSLSLDIKMRNCLLALFYIWATFISAAEKQDVIVVPDLRQQQVTQAVYKKFQPRVPFDQEFQITTPNTVFVKIPGLSLVLSHSYPMLYELSFEGVCRVETGGAAYQLDFLCNDHVLVDNKLERNDGTSKGRELWYWYKPMVLFRQACTRTETVFLPAGIHLIDVGIRLREHSELLPGMQRLNIANGGLTVKLTQFNTNQVAIGGLELLSEL